MQTKSSNTCQKLTLLVLLSLMLSVTILQGKVANCRPLPQCCRRFVFSPACRGVAAKRNLPVSVIEDNVIRDPRFFAADLDYASDNDFKNALVENIGSMTRLKMEAEEHGEYAS
ncbi:uncharacterized protein LOC126749397 [Anthonomus grandis grandis]|uniref:uncharacterized protein LOC126749397 n=1 Tax=Anthonomus grandis grandis TaxID=2921223 RepID=UPI002165B3AF|nr:uncharacterized protein LOC126749397 [Anthonomus grandis grandis]